MSPRKDRIQTRRITLPRRVSVLAASCAGQVSSCWTAPPVVLLCDRLGAHGFEEDKRRRLWCSLVSQWNPVWCYQVSMETLEKINELERETERVWSGCWSRWDDKPRRVTGCWVLAECQIVPWTTRTKLNSLQQRDKVGLQSCTFKVFVI